ncbi:MAG TPA: hypothetical protein VK658_07140 [Chryseolinea sp.]|nr:hypothetical protein [Chryseolinea sp.]
MKNPYWRPIFLKVCAIETEIESKKRKIPPGKAIVPLTHSEADIVFDANRASHVLLNPESFELIRNGKIDHLILPYNIYFPENDLTFSRFLTKIGLEMMAAGCE